MSKHLDIKEIAKLVRADIAAAIKAGTLANVKTQVRISRYSGGQSMTVNVVGLPDGFVLDNTPAREAWLAESGNCEWDPRCPSLYTAEGHAVLDKLEAIMSAYNWDNSDSQRDHFDVNFYQHVDFVLPKKSDAAA